MPPKRRWVGWAPAPPEEIRARLLLARSGGRFRGDVHARAFSLRLASPNGPTLRGSLWPADRGVGALADTVIDVEIALPPAAWLRAALDRGARPAVDHAISRAVRALADVLGVAATGEEAWRRSGLVGDPEVPGAEVRAPRSLRASATAERARFVVSGERPDDAVGRLLGGSGTAVVVTAGGVRVGRVSVGWDEVLSCTDADGPALVVATTSGSVVRADAAGHDPWEIRWLARYVAARADRLRATERERARAEEDRDELRALLRKR